MNLTPQQLAICTGASLPVAIRFLPSVTHAMKEYGIDSYYEQAAFLANIGHESGGFKWMTELWGPTLAQSRYEGRADLGNVKPGDGKLFRGHGALQVTGRFNHARVRDNLRKKFPKLYVPDFELGPQILSEPEWAMLSAADFWTQNNIGRFAAAKDFDGCCDAVNRGRKTAPVGDSNGWKERLKLFTEGLKALL